MGYTITTQMMAAALETDSVAKMAAIVGTPDDPVSLRRLFKDFRIKARPRPPADLEDTGPDYMYITWIDPGAGHFWRATAYNANLWREGVLVKAVDHTPNRFLDTNEDQKAGDTYTCYVQAFNEFGASLIRVDSFWDPEPPDISVEYSDGGGEDGGGGGGGEGGDDE